MRRNGFFIATLVAVIFISANAYAGIIDLTTTGANNGAGTLAAAGGTFLVQQISPQSTGTGVIDSFLRVQATGNEQGYNTSNGTPYDDKSGNFTRALTLSEVPIVHIGTTDYRQFLLDVNQTGSNPQVSLNQIEIFQNSSDPACNTPANTCNTTVTGGTGNNYPTLAFPVGPGFPSSPIFQMSAGGTGTPQSTILLDFSLNSGSGSGDMFLYVPNSDFGAGSNVILYNQFGNPPTGPPAGTVANPNQPTNDGFEEWAVLKPTGSPCTGACEVNVPEPTSLLLLGTGLAALGLIKRKRIQN